MQEYSYAQALNQGICEEMRRNEKVMVLGEDVGKYGGVLESRGAYMMSSVEIACVIVH